ncbi:hypothetical protein G3A45_05830 [Caloranaerobacter azorensis]|uniref:Transposase n=1 Tax=Caloranaerobacter azorensis TaxID=116090 RepID=A0A6P1YHA5_9FIRM|nr:hypothetical protein G3A45_05830 [Caloranaerobacter azorensis]
MYIKPTNYTINSGYDFKHIYHIYIDIINRFNGISIITYNPRGSYASPERLDEDFNPICSTGLKLIYWGKDEDYLKFIYPHALGKCNYPFRINWCSSSNYKYTLKINYYKENPRIYGYPLRSSSQWQNQYDKRTSVERCNNRLKGYLNLDNIRSKGIKKAKFHALLNYIVLVAGTISLNINKSLNKAA